jgi:hypothetical protein
MDLYRKMEAAGIGKIRRSKSRVYFDFAPHPYKHAHRRSIPEELADVDAQAMAEFAQ